SEKEKFWQPYSRAADNTGTEQLLFTTDSSLFPQQISHHGKRLLYVKFQLDGEAEMRTIAIQPGTSEKDSVLLLKQSASIGSAQFSPDDRWIAYSSLETGQSEIFVRPANGEDRKWQISTDGGSAAIWSPSGNEVFYLCGTKVMAVPYQETADSFSPGTPKLLFDNHLISSMDISPKGDRFLAVENPKFGTDTTLDVTTNWFDEVARKMSQASQP
ncbi:MAG TPA: hypothetical protein VFG11_10025, partial [Acidobacteriota bacterium]|nr:hypothetical protein [Acidobacteriota bacterium]